MSLYERYHSELNKQHILSLIKEHFITNYNLDIDNFKEISNIYEQKFIDVFSENNSDELVDMNKILLDQSVKNILGYLQENRDKLYEEEANQSVEEVNKNVEEEYTDSSVVTEVTGPEKEYQMIHLNSSKRVNIVSSRYNYVLDLNKMGISSIDLNNLKRMIIPIEDNYLFSQPILWISIPELNYTNHMQLVKEIKNKNRSYGIYETFDNQIINHTQKVSRITIDIRDLTETKYSSTDIAKVNIIEIYDNKIRFTCPQVKKSDYRVGDSIKIINNKTKEFQSLQSEPLKISKVSDNNIYCVLPEDYPNQVNKNVDMKLLNMSNQNILYFNQ